MLVLLHGAAGGLDEIAIGVVAFGVLWFAVKLAGRKPADDDEQEEEETSAPHEELEEPSNSAPTIKSN